MVRLYDAESGATVGAISDDQLQFLEDHLEEESSEDRDYYFDQATIDLLEEDGAEPALVAILRRALGDRDGVELRWERTA